MKKKEFTRPRKSISRQKYNNKGLFGKSSFCNAKLPWVIEATLVDTANYAISKKTKGVYDTAANMLQDCREKMNEQMPLPLSERDVLIFIGYNIRKGNKVGTIRSYLAGLKKFHLSQGFTNFDCYTPIVKEVLEGHENRSKMPKAGKLPVRKFGSKYRLPCTPTLLKIIKLELKNSKLSCEEKVFTWAASSLSFFGALRSGELLCLEEREFVAWDSLLQSDVEICDPDHTGKESVTLRIKNSKTKKGQAEIVTIYATQDMLCPVSAMKKVLELTKDNPKDVPLFCDSFGCNFTQAKFNKILRWISSKHFKSGRISGHSFRAGLVSYFAKLGHSDLDLKVIGGWSSRAFLEYIKLDRTRRHEMAVKASKIN